jgi:hypothetical protein
MASPSPPYCPYLGLEEDRSSHFSYPEDTHRCFASTRAVPIELEHQEEFCLGANHPACPDFIDVPEAASPPTESADRALEPLQHEERAKVAAETTEEEYWEGGPEKALSPLRIALWAVAGVMAILTLVYYGSSVFLVSPTPELPVATFQTLTPTATASPVITSAPTPFQFLRPTPTPTPPPGGNIYNLSPAASAVGWVTSNEEQGNHFGDSYMYVGIYGGNIYHGALQFDLSLVPRGAPIYSAIVQLTGLSEERLGASSSWELRMLEADADSDWPSHTYQDMHNFKVEQTIPPALGNADLGRNKVNIFTFTAEQRAALEERILETGAVSFRLDGPLSGHNDLFAWDTGYGPESLGTRPVLILSVGPAPSEPSSPKYIVLTSTPTPENVLTAAALVATATARATMIGTPTRMPANVVTATPLIVVTSTPTPENAATAQHIAAIATAVAMTTGEPTPTLPNMVTATPTPTFVLITSVPTPENVLTAAAVAVTATGRAATASTPTPLPINWVTPIVVTSTPTPENAATAQHMAAIATARAFTTGTPTSTPPNMVTATSIPLLIYIDDPTLTPEPTPNPTPDPARMPLELWGKIAFLSDREGEEAAVYVMDPDGSNVARLTAPWAYESALYLDTISPDGQNRVLVQNIQNVPQLIMQPLYDGYSWRITYSAFACYHPSWSPDGEYIAFVSQCGGHWEWADPNDKDAINLLRWMGDTINDDIYLKPIHGVGYQRLTDNDWEFDKHPSWSPDSRQIVFCSNREAGHSQIWVMEADGSQQRNISNNLYNDWDPVWIKWSRDIPSPLVPQSALEDKEK